MKIAYFGSLKTAFVKSGVEQYQKWLRPYIKLNIIALKSGGDLNRDTREEIQRREADLLLKQKKDEELIILEERGRNLSSVEFAEMINEAQVYSKELMFAIGGYTGFHDKIKRSSYKKISLSRMTFTHEMALLLLIEQIYRSMKILKGEKYHY
jgi:23S rRNA (pseudouridine1915-N3)-methyltransferase